MWAKIISVCSFFHFFVAIITITNGRFLGRLFGVSCFFSSNFHIDCRHSRRLTHFTFICFYSSQWEDEYREKKDQEYLPSTLWPPNVVHWSEYLPNNWSQRTYEMPKTMCAALWIMKYAFYHRPKCRPYQTLIYMEIFICHERVLCCDAGQDSCDVCEKFAVCGNDVENLPSEMCPYVSHMNWQPPKHLPK